MPATREKQDDPTFDLIVALHPLGFDFIAYPRGQKGPWTKEWQLKPKATIAQLRAAGNCNFGIRLGGWSKIGERYLVGLDIDIKQPEAVAACHAWLDLHLPEWRLLPSVISGSGGASRHVYGTFASSPTKTRTVMASGEGWNIDVRGNTEGAGCQNVWPGSLHPGGGIYAFERPFDVKTIAKAIENGDAFSCDLPTGLEFNADFEHLVFEKFGAPRGGEIDEFDDEDGLLREVLDGELVAFTIDDAGAILSAFSPTWWADRDNWRDAGMALQHQFGSGPEPFDLWCEMSQRAPEKFNLRVAQQQWRSFKAKRGGITMRSLIKQSNKLRAAERLRREEEFLAQHDDGCHE